jgi:hypothetical protein
MQSHRDRVLLAWSRWIWFPRAGRRACHSDLSRSTPVAETGVTAARGPGPDPPLGDSSAHELTAAGPLPRSGWQLRLCAAATASEPLVRPGPGPLSGQHSH